MLRRGTHFVRYSLVLGGLAAVVAAWVGVMVNSSRADIQIDDAWVQETNGRRAVLHLNIVSTGMAADRIVRGSTELAERVVFFNEFGQPSDSIRVPADSHWIMGDGLPRIELVDLKRSLKAPSSFALLLVFNAGGKFRRTVRVDAASQRTESKIIDYQ